ncbi:MAG: R3H domain-containing nucleic acid-binding protein [Candidatus Peregrinibacteria bacterium]|nr:R3H domain-containing nucleic acid-binding protein [Candidatus Peregrinibacteria bacterium]MDZ4244782.1 R3H domain-containing nucleic acid-binding protein [Candidatus Gracilibacteria bacterium]
METIIKNLLDELLIKMGIDFMSIRVVEEESNEYYVNIDSEEAKDLIGRHGATLQALQTLLLTILKRKGEMGLNIVLDVDGYRKQQIEDVKALADRKVNFLRNSKKPQALAPMSPFFRRVVHTYLNSEQFSDVTTESTGNGERRKVVLKLREA